MKDQEDQVAEAAPEEAADVPESFDEAWDQLDQEAAPEAAEPEDVAPEVVEPEPEQEEPAEPVEEPEPSDESDDELAKLEHKYRSELGRAEASANRAKQWAAEMAAIRKKREAAPEEPTEDRLTAAKEEYGDVVAPLVDELTEMRQNLRQEREDDLRQREESLKVEIEAIEKREAAVFEQAHPDGWETLKKHRDVFKDWIEDQPKIYRDIYARNSDNMTDGEGAALLVSRFKQAIAAADAPKEAPPEPPKRKTRLGELRRRQKQGAMSVPRGSRGVATTEPPPTTDFEKEWDYWDKRDANKR